jgi:hypothetical protein
MVESDSPVNLADMGANIRSENGSTAFPSFHAANQAGSGGTSGFRIFVRRHDVHALGRLEALGSSIYRLLRFRLLTGIGDTRSVRVILPRPGAFPAKDRVGGYKCDEHALIEQVRNEAWNQNRR